MLKDYANPCQTIACNFAQKQAHLMMMRRPCQVSTLPMDCGEHKHKTLLLLLMLLLFLLILMKF